MSVGTGRDFRWRARGRHGMFRAAMDARTGGEGGVRARSVAECLADPAHAGSLEGASRVGEAAADGRVVRIGVWNGDPGVRARFRASTCASLIAYAEAACAALEAGHPPPDARTLRGLVRGVHPAHEARAELVAAAVRAAFTEESP